MTERLTPEQLADTREQLLRNAEDWARWYPHLASSADLAAVLRAAARDARTLARVRAWTESEPLTKCPACGHQAHIRNQFWSNVAFINGMNSCRCDYEPPPGTHRQQASKAVRAEVASLLRDEEA